MSLHRHVKPLLSVQASLTDQVGKTFAILPSDADRALDHNSSWYLFIQPPVAPSPPVGPTPVEEPPCPCPPALGPVGVADLVEVEPPLGDAVQLVPTVVVETSADGVSWVDVMEPLPLDVLPRLVGPLVLGPYIRARTVFHGAQTHSVVVNVASNAPFRLELVA